MSVSPVRVARKRLVFAAGLASLALAACTQPGRPPSIVLVVIDTLRADRVSCYGYRRPTTPHIDALCERGVRFERAYSTSSWTLPAHASLFTGLPPIGHGATQERDRLGEGPATLAELVGERGYATFGVSANPLVSRSSGLARGFGEFVETWRDAGGGDSGAHPNLRAARDLLAGLDADRPFLLFVNFIEPHGPYWAPEPHRSRFLAAGTPAPRLGAARRRRMPEHYLRVGSIGPEEFAVLSDLYDGEVARADELVGSLVRMLDAGGYLDSALLVLTSDHGENLGDHGHFRHVFSLYRSTVRIPLVMVLPDGSRAGHVSHEPVGLVDVFATLLAWSGIEPPDPHTGGRDLLGASAALRPAPQFAEYYYPLQALTAFGAHRGAPALRGYLRRLRSVEHGSLRLIWSSDGRHELYDLRDDPEELRDVFGEPRFAESARELAALLGDYVARGGGDAPLPDQAGAADSPSAPDTSAADRLRELGYLP